MYNGWGALEFGFDGRVRFWWKGKGLRTRRWMVVGVEDKKKIETVRFYKNRSVHYRTFGFHGS